MRRNINKLGLIGVMVLILLIVVLVSCRSKEISRDLTGKIALEEIVEYSDTVDFYIKQINLIQMERLDTTCYGCFEDDRPRFNLLVSTTNRQNKTICLTASDLYQGSFFMGLLPTNSGIVMDTIPMTGASTKPILIEPDSFFDMWVSSSFISLYLKASYDNTENLLELIKEMKFYYAPNPLQSPKGKDIIIIDKPYRVRTDANTKITSWSSL